MGHRCILVIAIVVSWLAVPPAQARQGLPRPPAADAAERIDAALQKSWGQLPEATEVLADAAGRAWFVVPEYDLFLGSDALLRDAVARQAQGDRFPAPGLVPFWSDDSRVWLARAAAPHLLRSYDAENGRWQALHVDGRLFDGIEPLEAHLREFEARHKPGADRPGEAWLAAALGTDGTLHLVSREKAGLRLRSGRVDPERGVEQVAQWPSALAPGAIALLPDGLVALPGGEMWAFPVDEQDIDAIFGGRAVAPKLWRHLPGAALAWEPAAALNAMLRDLVQDPFFADPGIRSIVPLPEEGAERARRAMLLPGRTDTGNGMILDIPEELDEDGAAEVTRLIEALGHPDFQAREDAADALAMIPAARPLVEERLATEQDLERRERLSQVLEALVSPRFVSNQVDVAGRRFRFEGAQVISNGVEGRGAAVLLREVREIDGEGRQVGGAPWMLLGIPLREGPAPLALHPVMAPRDVEQPEAMVKQYHLRPAPDAWWTKPDEIWLANGWRLELRDGTWTPESHVPDAVVQLALRTVDREGRLYFGTHPVRNTQHPILTHLPSAPAGDRRDARLSAPPADARITEFPGIHNFEPVPAEASAGPGVPGLDGAWAIRRGVHDPGGVLVRMQDGMVQVVERPRDEALRISNLIPLRGGAIVHGGPDERAGLWDGQRWITSTNLRQLVHDNARALAAIAGNDAGMSPRGSGRYVDAIIAGGADGGLWFMESVPGKGHTSPSLRIDHFDGERWHDLAPSFVEAVSAAGGTALEQGSVPRSRFVIDGGRALVVQTSRPLSSWRVSLDGVQRMSAERGAILLVPDGAGTLWSPAFAPVGVSVGAWVDGAVQGDHSTPPPRTMVAREGFARAYLPGGSNGLMDGDGRPWLFDESAGPDEPLALVAHVRLNPEEQAKLHPLFIKPPSREATRTGLDVLGGSWASSGPLLPVRPGSGQRWTLDGRGRVWIMSPEGLQRLVIRAPVFDPDHFTRERWIRMAPGAQVVVAEHVAWPEGITGARLVVPDRGGLWVNPLPNEFGRAGATFFLPLPDGE